MEIKDSLTLYNELKEAGVREEQAQIQAKQLGGVNDALKAVATALNQLSLELKNQDRIMMVGFIICFTSLAYLIFAK